MSNQYFQYFTVTFSVYKTRLIFKKLHNLHIHNHLDLLVRSFQVIIIMKLFYHNLFLLLKIYLLKLLLVNF